MAQSVELAFDDSTDAAVRGQWALLAEAGLPTAQRAEPSEHHRPHLTLYAAQALSPAAEATLPSLVVDLRLTVRIGPLLLFGPRRNRYVLVRLVVASAELIGLQRRVADVCGADVRGPFGPGRWTPHVTLARGMRTDQVSPALAALGDLPDLDAIVRRCRRWDGNLRTAWWL